MESVVFICEDSIEGILTGVYDAWAEAVSSGQGHGHCKLRTDYSEQMELFCVEREAAVDAEKAQKVIRTLRARLGEAVYECLCYAMASREPDKAEAVYQTIVTGFSMKQGFRVFDRVTDPYVARCFDLKRNVEREIHREVEFLRFRELENGLLLAEIHPRNDVLMYLGSHFSDRLPLENFLIYDRNRRKALIHEKEKEWYLADGVELNDETANSLSEEEEAWQELFRLFCNTIAIENRENRALQRQFLPLRCRDVMTEFGGREGELSRFFHC